MTFQFQNRGSAPRVLDPGVHMPREQAGDELSHAGPACWHVPLAEDGFGETTGWLRDILRRGDHCVPSRSNPVKVIVDKVVAEPTGEAGTIDAP